MAPTTAPTFISTIAPTIGIPIIPTIAHAIAQTPIPTINIAIAILQNNNPGPVWPARQVYAVFPFYAWGA